MVKLHKECLKTKELVFAYGCAPHAIHNLCMDLIKNFPRVKHVLKQIIFMVKTLKSSHLLLQLFDKLCLEKFKKTYVLILFTKTRWGTVFFTVQRASTVKATCTTLISEILNAKLDIDICDELKALVTDPAYWKGVAAMETLFMTISSCLTYLEGNKATFSIVYVCVLCGNQAKAALVCLSNGNEDLRRSYFSEFATFIMRPMDSDYDFNDIKFKPSELWTLCDNSCYGSIKGPLSTLHKNPAGASGGKHNHKASKRVHNRSRTRLGQAKIEMGTAILFNAKQLDRRITTTRDMKFCKWLQQFGADNGDDVEKEPLDEEEDDVASYIEEFDRLDISSSIDNIVDEDLFDEEVVDEGNIFN
ncbi:unnamed protein product [Sphagnum troendelagicum]